MQLAVKYNIYLPDLCIEFLQQKVTKKDKKVVDKDRYKW